MLTYYKRREKSISPIYVDVATIISDNDTTCEVSIMSLFLAERAMRLKKDFMVMSPAWQSLQIDIIMITHVAHQYIDTIPITFPIIEVEANNVSLVVSVVSIPYSFFIASVQCIL